MHVSYVFLIFRRKTTARKARETRRSTQPVPTDLLQRIKQSDEVEEKELEDSLGGSGTTKPQNVLHNEDKNTTNDSTPDPAWRKGPEHTNIGEQNSKDMQVPTVETNTSSGKTAVLQSAYKPANRPASKILSDDESQPSVVISEVLSNSPTTINQQQSEPTPAG